MKTIKELYTEASDWVKEEVINESGEIRENEEKILEYWKATPARKWLPKIKTIWKNMSPNERMLFAKKHKDLVVYIAVELL